MIFRCDTSGATYYALVSDKVEDYSDEIRAAFPNCAGKCEVRRGIIPGASEASASDYVKELRSLKEKSPVRLGNFDEFVALHSKSAMRRVV